ncbi:hypothetical protein [Achromobacter aloeverae]
MTTLIPADLAVPDINQIWPGQGGRFVGLHPLGGFLIAAEKRLDGEYEFGSYGTKLEDYSDIDGAENTRKLIELGSAAAKAAAAYACDGHADFYLPSQRELMLCFAASGAEPDGPVVGSSTPYGSNGAWALAFEDGYVNPWLRDYEFAVLPVRRFIP